MITLPQVGDDVLAVGWATVELDRAARELSHLLAVGARFEEAAPSVILGARCRSGPAAAGSRLWVALLEPASEGRLAGTLARDGEGWAVTWLRVAAPGLRVAAPGPRSALRPGPFGPERLLADGRAAGPRRLALEAVPSPP